MKKIIILCLIWFLHCNANWDNRNLSTAYVVVVPFCDAPTKTITNVDSNKTATELYTELPYAPETGIRSCYRANQLLFNEVVEVFATTPEEYLFTVENAFYEDELRSKQSVFCTLKKYLVSLKELKDNGIDIQAIPSFYPTNLPNQVILRNPWKESTTGATFSAGTRFVRASQCDTQDTYEVVFLTKLNNTFTIQQALIPSSLCITSFPSTPEGKISLFIDILKEWANNSNGFIPYVSGGNSFCELYQTDACERVHATRNNGNIVSYWMRYKSEPTTTPLSGFDCSCLVLRAAQLAGIPYFCKTTTTLSLHLRPLPIGEQLQPGDLIWHSGHVVIIVDEHTIVESTGYTRGYGKVHMIPIHKTYENIHNCCDLKDAYANHVPLRYLNASGQVTKEITEFKLFRLPA